MNSTAEFDNVCSLIRLGSGVSMWSIFVDFFFGVHKLLQNKQRFYTSENEIELKTKYRIASCATLLSTSPNKILISTLETIKFDNFLMFHRLTEITIIFLIDFIFFSSVLQDIQEFTNHDCIIWQFSLSLCSHSTCLILGCFFMYFFYSSPQLNFFFLFRTLETCLEFKSSQKQELRENIWMWRTCT